ncbi:MAG: DUF3868 domain-containing protein [Rikenellaceae bacterium]|nr:DUF3868 domain-containing protein [Rikenellaceae bacterium]
MKKILLLILFTIALGISSQAQPSKKSVSFTDRKIELSGGTVTVQFRVDIGKRAAAGGRTLIYEPVLTNGTYRWSLPPVIIQGARARVAQSRHDWAAGHAIVYDNPKYAGNGSMLIYNAAAPWQLWMHGADLVIEGLDMGCCSESIISPLVVAENLDLPPVRRTVVEEVEVTEIVELPKTTGDLLAETVSYVRHASEMDSFEPGQLSDEDREGSLTVYFRQANLKVDPEVGDNYRTLTDMLGSIRRLQDSPDSRVSHVVVAGFASPEGSFDSNDRLAWNRAVAIKDYLLRNSDVPADRIQLYNGSEDWRGLYLQVEKSDLYDKSQILDIIDNVPIWDPVRKTGREKELMKLDGGRTYRYLYEHFFPKLRNAAYIKIYYENK